ncbi:MAG: sugar transferase [Clostridia bacterium]|nr:sugar transferase [Clostridia bacterium]
MYQAFVKRISDIVFSVLGLLVLSPLFLLIAILVRCTSKGPAVFRQERLGRDAKVFRICKFRTMAENSEHTGSGVYSDRNDSRVTKVGRFLRATSLDELPQLWNILRGDMSFIGPRPPLTYHPWTIDRYSEEQLRMFRVRPGITGWAQVHGRRELEWHERLRLNVWYADHVSFALDLKIVFLTVGVMLSGKGNENKGATV